ncbi:unnamed protein product [Orchesella dallaii]|uniref:Uncharacterized protein n=1 Tax=Orchesella dallaii TaxID=48710 RepID=A0ABP1RHB3_9HEXA
MNCYLFVFATIVVVVNGRAARQGWGVPASPPGWSVPTTVQPGWNAPPPSGWSAPVGTVAINIAADAAAEGQGWAASSQDLILEASSENDNAADPSVVSQSIVIGQSSGIDPLTAIAVNTVDANQVAYGVQGFGAYLQGGNSAAALANGWTAAAGEAQSSADGTTNILVNRP